MRAFNIVAAATIGHILEFYDFTIYAVFSVKIGELFFPNSSPLIQILSSLGIFAVGFLMRPLGGLIFGHIGDKLGRRTALTVSVVIMAAATFLIGLMPDYQTIGILAPILLILCRLVQGICVGGEGAGASIFIMEHLNKIKPGLIGGIVNAALTLGILLAIVTGIVLNNIFGVESSAWRYAFILGGVLGIAGLYIRLKVEETPAFEKIISENKVVELPIKAALKTNLKNVIFTIALGAITSTAAYSVMTFLNIFLHKVVGYDTNAALYYSAFANLSLVVLLPLMGVFSDRFGYGKTMAYSCVLMMLFSIPIYQMIASGIMITTLLGILALSTLVAMNYAPLYPVMINLFPPEQRYSGIAFSLNIGIAIFGGTSTMVCLYLVEKTQIIYAGAFFLDGVCALFLTTLYLTKKDKFKKYFFPRKIKNLEFLINTENRQSSL